MFHLRVPAPDDRLEWIGGDDVSGEAAEVAYEAVVKRRLRRAASAAGLRGGPAGPSRPAAVRPSVDIGLFRRWYVAEAYRCLEVSRELIRTSRPAREG